LTKTLGLPLWVPGKLEDSSFDTGATNEWGTPYEEYWMQSPFLEKVMLITPYEKNPKLLGVYDWMNENPYVPIAAVILYVIGVFGGQKLMEKREKAFDFRKAMAWWNLFLSTFSFIGVVRVLPEIVYKYYLRGHHELICGDPEPLYGSGAVGLWVQLFILSKLGELIDTVFLVLHKRPVIFLHWYHHVTVLVFCWFTYVGKNPGVLFCGMNYSVHAIMYFYYYLQAADRKSLMYTTFLPALGFAKKDGSCKDSFKKVLQANASRITTMQTSQMVVGVFIVAYYLKHQDNCKVDWELMNYCGIMYSSYFYLFAKVYYDKFVAKKPKQTQTDNPNAPTANQSVKTPAAVDKKDKNI
jgi:elongation of very long chain fatty acids protein 6